MTRITEILELAALGFSVLVCGPKAKIPLSKALPQACKITCTPDGIQADKKARGTWLDYQRKRATPDEITAWAEQYPDANWAVVTGAVSGIVVIDTDTQEAEEYAQSLGLPATLTVHTGGGGHHRYYAHPGIRVGNKQAVHGVKGLDIRGDGGYVVAPPSIHPSGNAYVWAGQPGEKLAALPSWAWTEDQKQNVSSQPPNNNGNGNGKREEAYIRSAIEGKLRDATSRVAQAPDGTKHEVLREAANMLGGYIHLQIIDDQVIKRELMQALPSTVKDRALAERTIEDGLEWGKARPLTIDVPPPSNGHTSSSNGNGKPAPQPAKTEAQAEGDDDDRYITVEGKRWKLPPGCQYHSGSIWRGEKLLYLGMLIVSETGVNVHTQEQTALIQWRGSTKGETICLRSDISSQSGIAKQLGGAGAGIHAHNAKDISRYLVEFITVNRGIVQHSKHSEYYGNVEGGLILPSGSIGTKTRYIGDPITVGNDREAYVQTLQAIKEWAPSILYALISMAISSPIYARLRTDRNPVAHLGGASGAGKTTITHFATGCYGDPRVTPLQVQCGSGTTTPKGMATALIQANGLPVFFDDVHKMLERKRQETEGIVYDFANGQNRSYGTMSNRKTGGGQEVRGLLITAGETSLNFMNAGSNNRVFSFDCGMPAQQPLGCPAKSNEGVRRSRQIQSAWHAGAGTFGYQVCESIIRDWKRYELDVKSFELDRHLEPLQAWRRLLAIAAATLQVIDHIAVLDLDIDTLMRQWSDILQANNQTYDPAEDAFDRVRMLLIQSEYTTNAGGGKIPTWHNLHYDRKLIACRRDGQDYWRVMHTTGEWKSIVGENALEMFSATWLAKGWIIPHKNGKISHSTWVGRGSPRCILVKDFLTHHEHVADEDDQ
jgi:hypothetical protein